MKHIETCRTVIGNRGVPRPKVPRSFGILVGRLRDLYLSMGMLARRSRRMRMERSLSTSSATKRFRLSIVSGVSRMRRGRVVRRVSSRFVRGSSRSVSDLSFRSSASFRRLGCRSRSFSMWVWLARVSGEEREAPYLGWAVLDQWG